MVRMKDRCKAGLHELSGDNLYVQPKSGKRLCRACYAVSWRKHRKDPSVRDRLSQNMRKWRAANRERDRKNWTELRRRKKEWIDAQKVTCKQCGESHIACLDFHHRDPSTKDFLLSTAVSRYTLERIKAEFEKCDVLCSNCHRKLHWEQRHGS